MSFKRALGPFDATMVVILTRGASPLGLPHTLSRAPLRRRAPFAWLARALARDHLAHKIAFNPRLRQGSVRVAPPRQGPRASRLGRKTRRRTRLSLPPTTRAAADRAPTQR